MPIHVKHILGPPGVGKTTLLERIYGSLNEHFMRSRGLRVVLADNELEGPDVSVRVAAVAWRLKELGLEKGTAEYDAMFEELYGSPAFVGTFNLAGVIAYQRNAVRRAKLELLATAEAQGVILLWPTPEREMTAQWIDMHTEQFTALGASYLSPFGLVLDTEHPEFEARFEARIAGRAELHGGMQSFVDLDKTPANFVERAGKITRTVPNTLVLDPTFDMEFAAGLLSDALIENIEATL